MTVNTDNLPETTVAKSAADIRPPGSYWYGREVGHVVEAAQCLHTLSPRPVAWGGNSSVTTKGPYSVSRDKRMPAGIKILLLVLLIVVLRSFGIK